MATTAPRTVLHVEQFGEGGAVASLLGLVQGLDPERYRSVVAFRTPNAHLDAFRAAGATVVVLEEGSAPATGPEPAASPAPEGPAPSAGAAAPAAPAARSAAWRREVRRIARRDLPATRRLRSIVAEHRPDVIHAANEVGSNRYAIVAGRLARVPVVQHVRGLPRAEPGLAQRVDRALGHGVARAIAISHAVADAVAVDLPALASRTVVIDNPFDLGAFPAVDDGRVARELGLAPGAVPLVLLGRLAWWKGQDVLIRAVAELAPSQPEAVAVLVGSAASTYGAEFEASLHDLAAELGVTDRVVFAGHRSDVPEVLAAARVVVHASTEPEPFGRVIVEAMAAGRPVVASAAGGVLEIVDDEETGVLVPPGDPAALAAAIAGLLDDPARASALAAAGRRAAVERFDLDAHARAVEAVYDEVLGG